MSIARIIWIVGLLAAIIIAFAGDVKHIGSLVVILGIIAGWFVDHEHRLGLIIAAMFMVGAGASAWGAIPELGTHLNAVIGSIGALMAAAAVTAILRTVVERILLGKGTGS